MHQTPLRMRFFARSSPMSCLPCWWRKPTGTMSRLLLHYVAWTTFHYRSSYECGECKEGSVHLTLTTIFCRCQQTVQRSPVLKPIQLKQTTTPKTTKKCFKENYKPTMYFVLCFVCCVSLYCVVPTIKCNFFQQNYYFFHKNVRIYFCVNN